MSQNISVEFIIYLIFNIASLYAYYYYFENTLKLKKKQIGSSLMYYLGMLVVSEAVFFIFHNNIVNLLVGTSLLFLITQIYSVNQIKKIMSVLVLVVMQMGIELLTTSAYAITVNESVERIVGNEKIIFILGAISKLLLLMAVQILSQVGQASDNKDIPLNWKKIFVARVIFLPIISIVVLHLSFALAKQSNLQCEYYFMITVTGVLVLNVLFVFIFDKLLASAKTDWENKMLNRQIQYYSMYWERVESEWNRAKTLRHNLKHNLVSIKNKIDAKNIEKASEEISKLLGENSKTEMISFSQIPIVDAVLNYECSIANEKNTVIKSRIFVNGRLKVRDEIISIILGNAIDNAIVACEKVESSDREISVVINDFQNNLYISISNPYEGKLKLDGTFPITTKNDKDFHGIGLKTIAKIVEQENGILNIDFEEYKFNVEIILFDALEKKAS